MSKKRQIRSADVREQESAQDDKSSCRVDESAYGYEKNEAAIQIGEVWQTRVERFWISISLW